MALKERKLWKKIKPILAKNYYAYRIESSITPGFPDVVLINKHNGDVFLLELKAWRSTSHIPMFGGMSTSQRAFHADIRKTGANNFVLAIDGNDHYYIFQPDGSVIKPDRVTDIDRLPAILLLRSTDSGRTPHL